LQDEPLIENVSCLWANRLSLCIDPTIRCVIKQF